MTDRNYPLLDGHPANLSLRIAALVSAFTSLAVFAWAIKAHDRVFTDLNGASLCVMILATSSYAVLWSLVPLTVRLLLRRALHPGVHIAFDFIAFSAVFATTLVTMIVLTPIAEGGYSCRRSACRDTTLPKVEFFGFAMALLTSVLHFVLFVWACWACDRLRKQPRKTEI
ncbi:hypothetical protein BDV32DRAFT_148826 [Aspergillus pseudonomiae]|uniref:Uncharacterized protein n=1 Tax=Aspergillus pseudonomiae TaxID=1506151 RepID=A0A5N6I2M4_9EURO|nr:uncharacterized protein BDV37DRAFT_282388 [Aspergillus pseudonomiae]KAB8260952.1 hypothetical protein BDV32DRAFT_148826 [Aspergillus pseudonomiae]KAE8404855.1 hypothetical protein BDV37DRAFT_282388 [Aspergillus pseudonomiae]